MKVIEVTGSDLKTLLRGMNVKDKGIYKMSFSIDGDYVKVKINEGIWSPPMGEVKS